MRHSHRSQSGMAAARSTDGAAALHAQHEHAQHEAGPPREEDHAHGQEHNAEQEREKVLPGWVRNSPSAAADPEKLSKHQLKQLWKRELQGLRKKWLDAPGVDALQWRGPEPSRSVWAAEGRPPVGSHAWESCCFFYKSEPVASAGANETPATATTNINGEKKMMTKKKAAIQDYAYVHRDAPFVLELRDGGVHGDRASEEDEEDCEPPATPAVKKTQEPIPRTNALPSTDRADAVTNGEDQQRVEDCARCARTAELRRAEHHASSAWTATPSEQPLQTYCSESVPAGELAGTKRVREEQVPVITASESAPSDGRPRKRPETTPETVAVVDDPERTAFAAPEPEPEPEREEQGSQASPSWLGVLVPPAIRNLTKGFLAAIRGTRQD